MASVNVEVYKLGEAQREEETEGEAYVTKEAVVEEEEEVSCKQLWGAELRLLQHSL